MVVDMRKPIDLEQGWDQIEVRYGVEIVTAG